MTIGDNIKRYRKENKLTQKSLGELIGKSTITIRKYEANDISPSIKVLGDIALALNITINDLTNKPTNHGFSHINKAQKSSYGYVDNPVDKTELDEFIDKIGIDKFNMAMELMKTLDDNVICTLDDLTLNMPHDKFIGLKNKTMYKNELDNQIPLHDKLSSNELELMYMSKINDLKTRIENQERMIKQLEEMNNLKDKLVNRSNERIEELEKLNDKLFSLLGGGTDGK